MRKIATLAALALVAAACGNSDSEPVANTTTTSSTTTTAAATTTTTVAATTTTEPALTVSYPEFTGGDFYAPASLPSGEHGDVIWAEEIDAPTGAKAWRVLYLSESVNGDPIGVSGFVMTPDAAPPEGGWPVISWAHGTTGLADVCAPTASPTLTEDLGTFFSIGGSFGFAMVATDYEGLGTPGVHTYIVGESAGRAVIDMMRAGRQIEEANLGDRYVAWGHSEGAHAVLFAGQLSETWAPELDLVGVVAGATPFRLEQSFDHLLGGPEQGYLMMTLVSYASVYPEADPAAVATPEALELLSVVTEGCLSDIQQAYEPLEALFTFSDITTTEPWASLVAQNVPAQTPISAPVLILHGEADQTIPAETSIGLRDQICELGGVAKRNTYVDKPHGAETVVAYALDMLLWMNARFLDAPAPNDCV